MKPSQREIVDSLKTRHVNGNISTGSYYVITSSYVIRSFHIQNPKRGPYANDHTTYLEFQSDNTNEWYTLGRGDQMSVDGTPDGNKIRLRTNYNGAGFQMVLLEDEDYFSGHEDV